MSYSKMTDQLDISPPARIHPLFPLSQETKANPALAYSDHLAILAQVPLSDDSTLNIISLNTLDRIMFSGVHEPNSRETDSQTLERYHRIVDGLKMGIEQHHVDILAFQEAPPKLIVPVLKEKLGDAWTIIEDPFKVVTCYRTDRWIEQQTASDRENRIRSITLCRSDNNAITVDFHNIWGLFDALPLNLERQCRKALENSTSTRAVIIGDTNSRLAPLDNTVRNITTGAVPLAFNEENGAKEGIQIPDHPDGGFYKDEQGQIHQLQTQILSFEDGSIVLDQRTVDKVSPWPEYRMVMCLDEHYQHTPLINNQTIFEYEQFLQREFRSNDIVARVAATCFNQKAIAIGLRPTKDLKPLCEYIKQQFENEPDFQFKRLNVELEIEPAGKKQFVYNCIFVPMDKIDLLHQVIADYSFQKNHPVLAATKHLFTTPSWMRDALIGVGIAIPSSLLFGPGVFALLGIKLSAFTLGGVTLSTVGVITGASVTIGSLRRNAEIYEGEQINSISLMSSAENSSEMASTPPRSKIQPSPLVNHQVPTASTDLVEDEENQRTLRMN
ncbi:MAG: hypothetical protein P4L79_14075 [Legionella sp.]|uniref:hypothetical protein n=1 Tax=Legionella sp. TaxID=459 RepID=UPI0028414007|nr:hypothetical protein [Legionella sp.]